jgi:hypothetical protein
MVEPLPVKNQAFCDALRILAITPYNQLAKLIKMKLIML